MREIIFDTETTGFNPQEGHRLVEIGCVEMHNGMVTGRVFHTYINPERDMPQGAFEVHGLSEEFLKDKPLFRDIVESFLAFVADAKLVAHNAEFDMRFLNAELEGAGLSPFPKDRVLDTLVLARRKHPGASNTLDALCARYQIDTQKRTKHGALLDAQLLADVYIELTGGRQASLSLTMKNGSHPSGSGSPSEGKAPRTPPLLPPRLCKETLETHKSFVSHAIGAHALWGRMGIEIEQGA